MLYAEVGGRIRRWLADGTHPRTGPLGVSFVTGIVLILFAVGSLAVQPVITGVTIPDVSMKINDVVTATIFVQSDSATVYTLNASNTAGQKQESLTISVTSPPPADQDPPVITNISHSPGKIWNYYTCGADAFTVSASVSDASSIDSVSIRFRVVKGAESGSWVERSLSVSGGNYQITIGPNDLKQSMAKYRGLVEYTISAEDAQGNTSQSGKKTIEVGECLL